MQPSPKREGSLPASSVFLQPACRNTHLASLVHRSTLAQQQLHAGRMAMASRNAQRRGPTLRTQAWMGRMETGGRLWAAQQQPGKAAERLQAMRAKLRAATQHMQPPFAGREGWAAGTPPSLQCSTQHMHGLSHSTMSHAHRGQSVCS